MDDAASLACTIYSLGRLANYISQESLREMCAAIVTAILKSELLLKKIWGLERLSHSCGSLGKSG